jgi:uncharacterized protein YlxW (UPF0749 family)
MKRITAIWKNKLTKSEEECLIESDQKQLLAENVDEKEELANLKEEIEKMKKEMAKMKSGEIKLTKKVRILEQQITEVKNKFNCY